jgi:hypothetical protein
VDEDAAALKHYNAWMNHYTSEETRATKIIENERSILDQVKEILMKAQPADEAAVVDKCTAEKSAYEAQAEIARASQEVCNNADVDAEHENANLLTNADAETNIAAKRDGKDITVTANVAADTTTAAGKDTAACKTAAKDAAKAEELQGAYNACLATGASELVSVKAALIEVQRLSNKYIADTKAFNEQNGEDLERAGKVLMKLYEGLNSDFQAMQAAVKADRAKETATLKSKNAASLAKFNKVLAAHKAKVAAAVEVRNKFKDAHRAEDEKWQKAQTAQNKAEANRRQTEATAISTKIAAEKAKLDADERSEKFYSTEKAKVDEIRLKDDTYLKKEYAAIGEIQAFVDTLDEKDQDQQANRY